MERAVAGAQDAWARNVFPAMKVTWGTYPNQLGPRQRAGMLPVPRRRAPGRRRPRDPGGLGTCHSLPIANFKPRAGSITATSDVQHDENQRFTRDAAIQRPAPRLDRRRADTTHTVSASLI